MNLECHQIILGKVKGLAVVLIVSTSMASTATAQIVPPLAEGLIGRNGDGISSFSLGYGAGMGKYMCFVALKGNLATAEGNEILDIYKLWVENQSSSQFDLLPRAINWKLRASIRHSQIRTTVIVLTEDE